MALQSSENAQLEQEIKDLQQQIAKLSALLTLRKMEKNHPRLESVVNQLEHLTAFLNAEKQKLATFGNEHLCPFKTNPFLKAVSRILCIGVAGYMLLEAFNLHSKK